MTIHTIGYWTPASLPSRPSRPSTLGCRSVPGTRHTRSSCRRTSWETPSWRRRSPPALERGPNMQLNGTTQTNIVKINGQFYAPAAPVNPARPPSLRRRSLRCSSIRRTARCASTSAARPAGSARRCSEIVLATLGAGNAGAGPIRGAFNLARRHLLTILQPVHAAIRDRQDAQRRHELCHVGRGDDAESIGTAHRRAGGGLLTGWGGRDGVWAGRRCTKPSRCRSCGWLT